MKLEVLNQSRLQQDNYIETPIESFIRMLATAKGDRVMLPHFGSLLYELVDKSFNSEWVIDFKRHSLDCCFDEFGQLWDARVFPKDLKVKNINSTSGEFSFEFDLELQNGDKYSVKYSN